MTLLPRIGMTALLLALVSFGVLHTPWASTHGPAFAAGPTTGIVRDSDIPQKARDVLEEIQKRKGEPAPGYVGGRIFSNREHRLPRGKYREYDVNPKIPGKSRGAERIVIEQRTGKAYYSRDHYETFVPMN